jgi:hypothetical protein
MPESGSIRIAELRPATRAWRIFYDPPHRILFVHLPGNGTAARLTLRLGSVAALRQDLEAMSVAQVDELLKVFRDLPRLEIGRDTEEWVAQLERLAFLLASYSSLNRKVQALFSRLVDWLLLNGGNDPWLIRFDESLSFASRYRLLARATREAETRGTGAERGGREERERYWLTTRLRFELAKEWSLEAISKAAVLGAVDESRAAYLELIRSEPYRRELDEYLGYRVNRRSHVTGTEREVAHLLDIDTGRHARGEHKTPRQLRPEPRTDEAVDRVFLSWFLQRHALGRAFRLIWRRRSPRERRAALVSLALVGAAAMLFAVQVASFNVGADLYLPRGLRLPATVTWTVQVSMQAAALIVASWLSPACFSIVLPRALFGSLFTWITLIVMSIPGLWMMELEHHQYLRVVVHDFLSRQPLVGLWASMPLLVLVLVFVMREIAQWTSHPLIIIIRSVGTTFRLLLGSLFWGLIFARPIEQLLAYPKEEGCVQAMVSIAVIGSSLAMLFAMIVELVWDEKSMAEPLGEPV